MADNVTSELVVAPGAVFATDDDGGVQHPYSKLEWGANNTFTKVDTGAGALPIQDGGNSITVDGTFFQATQPVSATSLPLPTGAASLAAQTQPGIDIGDVTVNNASGASAVNVQDGGNSLTIDGTVAVSGTVAVTQSGTWDEIGINDSGNSITIDNAQLSIVGSGTEAAALRVTIATDSTGLLSVDDNGGSLTIDGTVTVNALPAGTNNIGDVDVLTLPASSKTIKRAVGNAVTNGDNTAIAAPGASKVIKVISYALQAVGTVNGKFTDGAAGTQLSLNWNLQAREGVFAQPTVIPQYHFKCTANTALILVCNSTAGLGFEITYWDDDAS